ncbi:MAG: NFACT RNA binding domain-containing protein [Candidatus Marsarchaeota archaeon]|jgi:predicted ribosome quality control (RQC) complex YloA/Tae2 family protein|nr:NFACT RNA binding domain-containing protein [Candidatus Marsarchaeota archaeon]
MDVVIDFTKSAQENAQSYFEKSKKAKAKAEGARLSAEELKAKFAKVEEQQEKQKKMKTLERREWFEKFNWFFTSSGLLAIGGRSADQNEELNSKHFAEADLFFHADIFGASVVILKDGKGSGRKDREEAAQLSASFSKAWDNSQTTVDVYALDRGQVTKSRNSGSLGKGSFVLKGEREWYKNTPLGLCAFMEELGAEGKKRKVACIAPLTACENRGINDFVGISLGKMKKSDAAKLIAKKLGYDDVDYIMQHLPAGPFSVR